MGLFSMPFAMKPLIITLTLAYHVQIQAENA